MGDKSLLQGIFRASLKEIELSDLGEEKEEAEYRVKYRILSYAPPACTGTLKVRNSASFVSRKRISTRVDRHGFNFNEQFNKFLLQKPVSLSLSLEINAVIETSSVIFRN